MIGVQTKARQDLLLLVGALAAAALTFPRWGPAAPLVCAAATLAVGAGRRRPAAPSIAAASAAAAGFVHFGVAPEHFVEWWGFGAFFILCGEAQLGWALVVRRAPGKAALSTGLAGSLLLVALWALSRTSGFPLGPEPGVPEAVGAPDVLAVALELVTAASCTWALAQRGATKAVNRRPFVVCALVLTATAAGLALLSIN